MRGSDFRVREGATGIGKRRGRGSNVCRCSIGRVDCTCSGMLLFLCLSQGGCGILSGKRCLVKLLLGNVSLLRQRGETLLSSFG